METCCSNRHYNLVFHLNYFCLNLIEHLLEYTFQNLQLLLSKIFFHPQDTMTSLDNVNLNQILALLCKYLIDMTNTYLFMNIGRRLLQIISYLSEVHLPDKKITAMKSGK